METIEFLWSETTVCSLYCVERGLITFNIHSKSSLSFRKWSGRERSHHSVL